MTHRLITTVKSKELVANSIIFALLNKIHSSKMMVFDSVDASC